ncbi:hydroxyethylthiazole kinase [Antarctobacter jejuensis]|uniref:hydroxyethylthiazole kinase n=1 Tax=Antarctobacter jejuensis TaxID=1439938 RepID=UPI003FD0EA79
MTPAQHLTQMRAAAPLVQNITNYVAMNVMANVMLAAGASPAMVHAREEAAEFAGIASALTINIGTLSPGWVASMTEAAAAAQAAERPWVLDPVAVGATAYRRQVGAELLALKPAVIRGNASEILALTGAEAAGRGADAADTVEAAEEAAGLLAARQDAVVAVTGAVDFVTDGSRVARISNGHALMPRVTALGCSLTGIVGAFVAGQDRFDATVAALAYYGIAGEDAAKTANGPGSFQVAFLDALYRLTPDDITARARVAA